MKVSAILIGSLLLFAWSCSGSGDSESYKSSSNVEYTAKYETEPEADAEAKSEVEPQRKLIKNGSIEFETRSVEKAETEVVALVEKHNGYLSNQNQNDYGERLTYSMQARVPAQNFDSFFNDLKTIADRIENQNINVQDVTQEFIDVEARIKTKKELEQRYITLLNKARTVDEMLNIERELGVLRSDIESLEGRLKYLKNQTNFSTVQIQFYQAANKRFGFFGKLKQAFVTGWNNFLSIIIGLIASWPYILLLAGILFLVLKVFRRRKP